MQIADENYRLHPGRPLNQGHHESSRYPGFPGASTDTKVHRHPRGYARRELVERSMKYPRTTRSNHLW